MRILFVLSLLILHISALKAQVSEEQLRLVQQVDFTDHSFDARHPSFMMVGNNVITRFNPLSLTLASLLYGYQKFISPQLQSRCPYEISCSAFSKASIQQFGMIKGLALTADRLTRCNQFTMIDLLPSQINESTGQIKDDLAKYGKVHRHAY